jgi:hypothetical protein
VARSLLRLWAPRVLRSPFGSRNRRASDGTDAWPQTLARADALHLTLRRLDHQRSGGVFDWCRAARPRSPLKVGGLRTAHHGITAGQWPHDGAAPPRSALPCIRRYLRQAVCMDETRIVRARCVVFERYSLNVARTRCPGSRSARAGMPRPTCKEPRQGRGRRGSFATSGMESLATETERDLLSAVPGPARRLATIARKSRQSDSADQASLANSLPGCVVPECDGISQSDPTFREGLWDRYFTRRGGCSANVLNLMGAPAAALAPRHPGSAGSSVTRESAQSDSGAGTIPTARGCTFSILQQ